jgi:hypothetical protein
MEDDSAFDDSKSLQDLCSSPETSPARIINKLDKTQATNFSSAIELQQSLPKNFGEMSMDDIMEEVKAGRLVLN